MHKIIALAVIVLIASVSMFIYATKSHNILKTITINNTKLHIEIATTSQEKQLGLCCRESLPENQGMLFVYDQPGKHNFWMKDTLIPLDMFWISSAKKIIHIEHSVQPSSYPKTFGPKTDSRYVLETNAGIAKKQNIKVGDNVDF